MNDSRSQVRRITQELQQQGSLQIPAGEPASVGEPIAVHDHAGDFESWMVPLTIGGKLVAWAQFSSNLILQRFSIFMRREGDLENCPNAEDWLNPGRVAERVERTVGPGAAFARPILTYDRDASRLAWLVVSSDSHGATTRWFVAGQSVWQDPGLEEVTG